MDEVVLSAGAFRTWVWAAWVHMAHLVLKTRGLDPVRPGPWEESPRSLCKELLSGLKTIYRKPVMSLCLSKSSGLAFLSSAEGIQDARYDWDLVGRRGEGAGCPGAHCLPQRPAPAPVPAELSTHQDHTGVRALALPELPVGGDCLGGGHNLVPMRTGLGIIRK